MRPLALQRRNWVWRAYIIQQPLDLKGMHTSCCPLNNIIQLSCTRQGCWTFQTAVLTKYCAALDYCLICTPDLSCCFSQVGWKHSWSAQKPQAIKRGFLSYPCVLSWFFLVSSVIAFPVSALGPKILNTGSPLYRMTHDGASWRWWPAVDSGILCFFGLITPDVQPNVVSSVKLDHLLWLN